MFQRRSRSLLRNSRLCADKRYVLIGDYNFLNCFHLGVFSHYLNRALPLHLRFGNGGILKDEVALGCLYNDSYRVNLFLLHAHLFHKLLHFSWIHSWHHDGHLERCISIRMVFRKAFLTFPLKIFMELGDVPSELEAHSLDIGQNIIPYAKKNKYSQYTSTLEGAWIASIRGLNGSIRAMFATFESPPELSPDEDYSADPLASFGITEARLHRSRGVTLGMFLGLMKYYRQAYHDVLRSFSLTEGDLDTALTYINRFFDRLEIGFCLEWAAVKDTGTIRDLQAGNRAMTNEKNRYLTIFESLFTPVIIMEEDNTVNNYNFAASFLFDTTNTGMQYYATEGGEKPLPR